MSKKYLTLLTIIFLNLFLACDKKIENPDNGLNDELKFSLSDYETTLKNGILSPDSADITIKSIKANIDTIKYFYSTKDYKPLFIESFESKNVVDSLLVIIGNSYSHGLNPERYHFTQIKNEFYESIKPGKNSSDRYTHLAHAELLVADAILNYSTHMRHGVVNPRKIYPDSYFLPVKDSLNKQIFEPFNQENIIHYLHNIQPKSEKYKKLQTELIRFESLQELNWILIPVTERKIKIGDSYSSINLIAQRLTTLGFLDTNKIKLTDFSVYDTLLSVSVKNFQKAIGFNGDGIIDKGTIERLNISPKDYVKKIKITLERFRWLDYSDTLKFILVNIPDFKLYAVEKGVEKFNITICTGRKGEWETPNLYGEISYLVLNPTWSVPRSIIEEEIVSGLRKDSLYLKKRNFKVYKSGERVSLDGLTASDLYSSKRYSIVQDPGAGNALGKIKFMFKNPFGVYLHDTPTRAPFKYTNRAVSHGCMRVEKPMLLAEYLLANNSSWNLDYVKIEIGQKVDDEIKVAEFNNKRSELRKNSSYGVTTEVKFDKFISLFVDYYTVWVDKDGIFNVRDDVYGRDKLLTKYLLDNN